MVEVMKIMVTSFKWRSLSVPSPAGGHANPHLHQRLLDTPGQVWVSLLWGHSSFLLGPGAHKLLFFPFRRPVLVLAALWWVNGDLLQEGLCHTQVCCTQSPCPAAVHC